MTLLNYSLSLVGGGPENIADVQTLFNEVRAIINGQLTDNNVQAGAGIQHAKLASLGQGKVLVGSAASVPTARSLSGDVTMDGGGVVSIADNAVDRNTIADDAVGANELADLAVGTAHLQDDAVTPAKMAPEIHNVAIGNFTMTTTSYSTLSNQPIAAGTWLVLVMLAPNLGVGEGFKGRIVVGGVTLEEEETNAPASGGGVRVPQFLLAVATTASADSVHLQGATVGTPESFVVHGRMVLVRLA